MNYNRIKILLKLFYNEIRSYLNSYLNSNRLSSIISKALIINFIFFILVPYLTYLKPAKPRNINYVDLLAFQKEEEQIEKKKKIKIKMDPDTENLNKKAKENKLEYDKVYQASDLDDIPHPLYAPKPKYPLKAKANSIEAEVIVKFIINYFGYVENIVIIYCSHQNYGFEKAVLNILRIWRFNPPTVDGKPAVVNFVLPIKFKLE